MISIPEIISGLTKKRQISNRTRIIKKNKKSRNVHFTLKLFLTNLHAKSQEFLNSWIQTHCTGDRWNGNKELKS